VGDGSALLLSFVASSFLLNFRATDPTKRAAMSRTFAGNRFAKRWD